MEAKQLEALVTQEARRLMNQTGANMVFSGVKTVDGDATGQPCLVLGVEQKLPLNELPPERIAPAEVAGAVTDVIELARPTARPRLNCQRAYDLGCDRAIERHRPLLGGVSMFQDRWSWAREGAGTLGLIVRDATDGALVGLTNNHCLGLAHSPAYGVPWFSENDPAAVPVTQPAIWDAGSAEHDRIGAGKRAVAMAFSQATSLANPPTAASPKPESILTFPNAPDNVVDGALIALAPGVQAGMGVLAINPGPFPFAAPEEVTLGMLVYKAGRTTGRVPPDFGTITSLSVGSNTDYGGVYSRLPGQEEDADPAYVETLSAHFVKQMAFQTAYTGDVVELGGDSGSVALGLIDGQFKVLGLYSAGIGGHTGLFHPIWEVAAALHIEPYEYVVGQARSQSGGNVWYFGLECAPGELADQPAEATPDAGPPAPAPVAQPAGELEIPIRNRADAMEVYVKDFGNPSTGHITYGGETFRVAKWREDDDTQYYLGTMVFEGVWIPQGAALQSAVLSLYCPENGGVSGMDVRVLALCIPPPYPQDSRRPQSFQVWSDYDGVPAPGDFPAIHWVANPATPGVPLASPDLSPMLQYLINKPEWVPGGGVMLTLKWFGLSISEGEQQFYGLGPNLAHEFAPRLRLVWGQ